MPRRPAPSAPQSEEHPPEGGHDDRVLRLFELLGRRWALRVLWELHDGPLGFRALQARGGGISASVLARRLADLVTAGVLEQNTERHYALSTDGRALVRILTELERWAAQRTSTGDM